MSAITTTDKGYGLRPITWQDIRLAVGEGPLSAQDVFAGCNAELRRRALNYRPQEDELVGAIRELLAKRVGELEADLREYKEALEALLRPDMGGGPEWAEAIAQMIAEEEAAEEAAAKTGGG